MDRRGGVDRRIEGRKEEGKEGRKEEWKKGVMNERDRVRREGRKVRR